MLFSSTCIRNCFWPIVTTDVRDIFQTAPTFARKGERCLAALGEEEIEEFLWQSQEGDVPAWPGLKYLTSFLELFYSA